MRELVGDNPAAAAVVSNLDVREEQGDPALRRQSWLDATTARCEQQTGVNCARDGSNLADFIPTPSH
jgi:hypothetical protein